jgi:hypothetical protein
LQQAQHSAPQGARLAAAAADALLLLLLLLLLGLPCVCGSMRMVAAVSPAAVAVPARCAANCCCHAVLLLAVRCCWGAV